MHFWDCREVNGLPLDHRNFEFSGLERKRLGIIVHAIPWNGFIETITWCSQMGIGKVLADVKI